MSYSLLVYCRESLLLLVLLRVLLLILERGGGVEVTLSSFMVESNFSSALLFL
jgi:hypothetical protein